MRQKKKKVTVFFMVSVATMSELSSRTYAGRQSERRLMLTFHSTKKWRPSLFLQALPTLTRSFPCLCSNLKFSISFAMLGFGLDSPKAKSVQVMNTVVFSTTNRLCACGLSIWGWRRRSIYYISSFCFPFFSILTETVAFIGVPLAARTSLVHYYS